MALRKANMGELVLKYSEAASRPAPTKAQTSPAKLQSASRTVVQQTQKHTLASPPLHRGTKRLRWACGPIWCGRADNGSDDISSADKENEDIENPKKRPRGPPVPPTRTTSKVQPSQVLSPRSANSRTLPRSPVHPTTSPGKSLLARPISPLKPAAPLPAGGATSILTNMVEKAKTTRGAAATRKIIEQSAATRGAGRGKKAAAPAAPPKEGRGRAISDSSDASTGTQNTVVRKPVAGTATAKKAPAKRTVMSTIKGMGAANKKTPAPKATAPATGTRVLRKRN